MTSILKNLQNEARQFSLHDPEETPAPQSSSPEEEEAEVNTNGTTTWLVLTAQVISLVYSPFYLPVFAFVALFSFSYLKLLPLQTKVWLTLLVFFFTVLLPRLGAVIFTSKKILTSGHNTNRTNPTQVKYNRYRPFHCESCACHAEMSALQQAGTYDQVHHAEACSVHDRS